MSCQFRFGHCLKAVLPCSSADWWLVLNCYEYNLTKLVSDVFPMFSLTNRLPAVVRGTSKWSGEGTGGFSGRADQLRFIDTD